MPRSDVASSSITPLRRVVVILGMHRSGTSACAQLLHGMGLDFGPNLLGANRWNPFGYSEAVELVLSHDAILSRLGRNWTSSFLLNPLPVQWWEQPGIGELRERLRLKIRQRQDNPYGIMGYVVVAAFVRREALIALPDTVNQTVNQEETE